MVGNEDRERCSPHAVNAHAEASFISLEAHYYGLEVEILKGRGTYKKITLATPKITFFVPSNYPCT